MLTSHLHFSVTRALVLYQLLFEVTSEKCGSEYSILGMMLQGHVFRRMKVPIATDCLNACNQDVRCQSFNYAIYQYMCELNNRTKEARPKNFVPDSGRYYYGLVKNRVPIGSIPEVPAESCEEIKASEGEQGKRGSYWLNTIKPGILELVHCRMNEESCQDSLQFQPNGSDGGYQLTAYPDGFSYEAFCDMTPTGEGWTLIARFSNNDAKNWMKNNGDWWYDKTDAFGKPTKSSNNYDMISPAFWLVSGHELKITRSDDPHHTPLLQTTGECLGGQTFRSKITSYGNFRNGVVWASDRCLGSCTVRYGGDYQTTDGFQMAECNGDIQGANKIGFWCDFSSGDGSVIMIGGGGKNCSRADHGIGITEANAASFALPAPDMNEYDFGIFGHGMTGTAKSYSLNLWVR